MTCTECGRSFLPNNEADVCLECQADYLREYVPKAFALEIRPVMDEATWLASTDPARMLAWLKGGPYRGDVAERLGQCPIQISARKLRLFGCAWRRLANMKVRDEWEENEPLSISSATWVEGLVKLTDMVSPATQAALLRDIVGNPFRPVSRKRDERDVPPLIRQLHPQHWPEHRWLHNPDVLAIARRAYDRRDFAALPILADALEEAGCDNEDILRHCRGWQRCPACAKYGASDHWQMLFTCAGTGWLKCDGPHVRGCWVVDMLLGKK